MTLLAQRPIDWTTRWVMVAALPLAAGCLVLTVYGFSNHIRPPHPTSDTHGLTSTVAPHGDQYYCDQLHTATGQLAATAARDLAALSTKCAQFPAPAGSVR